jgi:hypothetical protein
MAFKLGTSRKQYAVNGQPRTKLSFDKEGGDPDLSVPGTPVIKKNLPLGTKAEANMDGTIYLNTTVWPNNKDLNKILMHEMVHATEIKLGKLKYTDDNITYNGEVFARATRDGKDMIKFEGRWVEAGDSSLPWESDANITMS